MIKPLLMVAALAAITPPARAQTAQTVARSEVQLVVFNRPGVNWEDRASAAQQLLAHRDLYVEMAQRGDIVLTGRFIGEPLLGMSIFAKAIDQARVRARLEADPAVTGGYIALEFRAFVGNPGAAPGRPSGQK